MPMRIFIGSSREAQRLAGKVAQLIESREGMHAVLWSDLFPAGIILLEQIERLPEDVTGAVLLATPDVDCTREGDAFAAPIPNILFEYGYLSARLGRRRVAILQVDGVELPSDLQGVRVIRDTQRRYRTEKEVALLPETGEDLLLWLDQLPTLAPGLPAMAQVHGYSGTWDVRNRFTRWRDHDVVPGDDVFFIGKTFLTLDAGGTTGSGVQVGTLYVSMGGYQVEREVVNEIVHASVHGDGTLRLRLKMVRSRVVPGSEHGVEHADARMRGDLGHVVFPLELRPATDEARTLRGPHDFERAADAHLQLAQEKFVHTGLTGAADLER